MIFLAAQHIAVLAFYVYPLKCKGLLNTATNEGETWRFHANVSEAQEAVRPGKVLLPVSSE